MRLDRRRLCVAIALLGVNLPLYALGLDSDDLTLRGFGTVGVMHSTYDQADFKPLATVATGAGRSANLDWASMSRVGVQVDATLNEKWSSTLQILSEYSYRSDFSPQVSNAFFKYQMSPDTAVRAGRFVLPSFMLTDVLKIGYAQPWANAPYETYRFAAFYEGADITHKFKVNDIAFSAQGFLGSGQYKSKPGITLPKTTYDNKWVAGVSLLADVGAWTLRASHIENKFASDAVNRTLSRYRAAGYTDLADQYDPSLGNKVNSFDSLGFIYDPGAWFARGEMTKMHSQVELMSIASTTTGYLAIGYRVGKWTPYTIYSTARMDNPSSIGSQDPIGIMNGIFAGSDPSRSSVSVGTRWDFADNMDLKVQFSRVSKGSDTSRNGLANYVTGAAVPDHYNVISAGIDFVF